MSAIDFNDELVQDYLAESREHLSTIEADLLLMERAGRDIDEKVVNRVFRAAHSIKGGAGFFSLEKIRELAHRAESALDLVRCRQLVPSPDIVSILLLAFDKLRSLLDDHVHSNEADISEFVVALSDIVVRCLPPTERASLEENVRLELPGGKSVLVSVFDLAQIRRSGQSLFSIDLDLIHDVQRVGKTPLAVLRQLMQSGTLIESFFDLDEIGTLDDEESAEFILCIVFATHLAATAVSQSLGISVDRVRALREPSSLESGPLASMQSLAVAVTNPAALAPAPALPSEGSGPINNEPLPPAEDLAPRPATPPVEATIRVNVDLLDSLMTLAGELVLSRNQLSEAVANRDEQAIQAGANRLNLVTSEMQAAVALARMQPVGTLFAKFPRLVRDLSRDLGKQVELRIEGGEVEMDKTILEGLSDPLTHMIRNSVDHGVETPEARLAAGKTAVGTIILRAAHEAGQVVIEIADDGKGLRPEKIAASALARGAVSKEQLDLMTDREKMGLIFLPGVSTAETVSSVSGRGVGMDVVKTNLDKLGGKVDIDSVGGRGTSFRIKLPLTLAIIPSLLVSDHGRRFAIPQVSVGELIRLSAKDRKDRIDRAGDGPILLLRDRLVPLVDLGELMGAGPRPSEEPLHIAIVRAGAWEYGLVVTDLHDTVEIVVKPLGRHLQQVADYAGATVLGDGQVALILDISGLAARAGLKTSAGTGAVARAVADGEVNDQHVLLLFRNGPDEPCALPIELVTRIERIQAAQIQHLGGRRTMPYRGASLPVVALCDFANVSPLDESQSWVVIVFERAGRSFGLLAAEPLDMIETALALDSLTLRQPGVAGSTLVDGQTTLVVDILELGELLGGGRRLPSPASQTAWPPPPLSPPPPPTVLVVEDSDFFRDQIRRMVESAGYPVSAVPDGEAAWTKLQELGAQVGLVVTDLEMPRLDGIGLTRRIRAESRFAGLPVIALSSLAGEDDIAGALAAGVTEYQVKLNQEQLLEGIRRAVATPVLA